MTESISEPTPTIDGDGNKPLVVAIIVFSALSLFEAFASKGFLEADSCTHYMYARFAFANPHYFTNVWGRPVCTALYSGPAWLAGRLGVRATSLCVAVGLALVSRAIAVGQGWRWPGLALLFTLAQPLVFLHSFSELTELPFALLLALGFWAYQQRRFWPMALAIGMTPLSRPEGFGFVLLAAMALVAHRRPISLLVLVVPLVAWDWAGWHLSGSQGPWWHWLAANWPYAEQSLYDRGPMWHFVALMPVVTSPLIFPATVLGVWLCLTKSTLRSFFTSHRRRCEMLIAILPLIILTGHSVLYWRGKMASNGEVRYMLTVATFWALLAARGWGWVFDSMHWASPLRWAGVAALSPMVINLFYPVLPLRSQPDWVRAGKFADWYRAGGYASRYPFLAASHPGIFYALDLCPSDRTRTRDWRKDVLDPVPPGTLLVFDGCYGWYNADPNRSLSLGELIHDGWTPLQTPFNGKLNGWDWQVFVSHEVRAK